MSLSFLLSPKVSMYEVLHFVVQEFSTNFQEELSPHSRFTFRPSAPCSSSGCFILALQSRRKPSLKIDGTDMNIDT